MMASQTQSRRCSDGTEIKWVWEHIKEASGCMLGGLGRTHSENWVEARQAKVGGRYAVGAGKQPGRGPEACGFSRSTNRVLSQECECDRV